MFFQFYYEFKIKFTEFLVAFTNLYLVVLLFSLKKLGFFDSLN